MYCFIEKLIPCLDHIPKMHSSQYALMGFEFSEKSWIYLLGCQLLLSDGIASIVAALSGLLAGYLYDQDGYGIQSYRLPARLVVSDRYFYKVLCHYFVVSVCLRCH